MLAKNVNKLTGGHDYFLIMGDGNPNTWENSVVVDSSERTRFPGIGDGNDSSDILYLSLGYDLLIQPPQSPTFTDNIMQSIIRFLSNELNVAVAENLKIQLDTFARRETEVKISKITEKHRWSIQEKITDLLKKDVRRQHSSTPSEYSISTIRYNYSNIRLTIVSNSSNKKLDNLRDSLLTHLEKYCFKELLLERRVKPSPRL